MKRSLLKLLIFLKIERPKLSKVKVNEVEMCKKCKYEILAPIDFPCCYCALESDFSYFKPK